MAGRGFRLPWGLFDKRATSPAARERTVNEALRRALFAHLDHDYAATEESLADAVRADSDALDAYLALARFYRDRGEIGRAIRVHQNLMLRRDLDARLRAKVLLELARDFHRGGFLSRALACYEEVLSHQPRNVEALDALMKLHASLRDFPKALAASKRLARAEKRKDKARDANILADMAEFAHSEGRADEARKAAKAALRRDSGCARAQSLLGTLEAERGKDKAALAAWQKVPPLDRRLAIDVYPRIEAAYATLGRAREYETFLRGQVELRPDDEGTRLALARYLNSRGEIDMARKEIDQVLARNPGDRSARILLGRLLLAANRDADALAEYARLLDEMEEGVQDEVAPLEEGLT